MSDNTGTTQPFVCTYDEGRRLLAAQTAFYLRTCGCRERHPENHADNNCGLCVDACHFAARAVQEGELQVDRKRCFGCALRG